MALVRRLSLHFALLVRSVLMMISQMICGMIGLVIMLAMLCKWGVETDAESCAAYTEARA